MDPISYYTSVLSIFNTLDKCFCAWCDCIYFYASGVLLKRFTIKSDVNKRWDVIILSGTLTYVIAMLNEQIDFGVVEWEIQFCV